MPARHILKVKKPRFDAGPPGTSGKPQVIFFMNIKIDDLRGAAIHQLLQEHLQSMAQHSPPESVHALDIEALRKPEVTFWTAWEGDELLGCGALKQLDPEHAEIKSMRTASSHLRKGVAKAVLNQLLQ